MDDGLFLSFCFFLHSKYESVAVNVSLVLMIGGALVAAL